MTCNPWTLVPRLAALAAVALTLQGCGGGGRADPAPAQREAALAASQPGTLLSYVKKRLVDQPQYHVPLPVFAPAPTLQPTGAAADASRPAFASTTIQEAGIDEADLLKTDGTRIYSLVADPQDDTDPTRLRRLRAHTRADDGSTRLDATLTLSDEARADGFHLSGDGLVLAVVGQTTPSFAVPIFAPGLPGIAAPFRSDPPKTVIDLVSTSGSTGLAVTNTLRIDGQLIDSRTVGNLLYVVTTWQPSFDTLVGSGPPGSAERIAAVERLTTAEVLPTLVRRIGGVSSAAPGQPLMADTDCYVQADNASPSVQLTTITVFDLASAALERTSRCFVGGTEAFYMSDRSIYLATTRIAVPDAADGDVVYPAEFKLDVHKFAIALKNIGYRGSGVVPGHLGWDPDKTALRMSEHRGDLRILTFTGETGWAGEPGTRSETTAPSPARLTILREATDGGRLETVATLPNAHRPEPIGLSGEQVYSVRFVGDRGYVVTFQRTDPLYVLDLSDPGDPRVTGELKTKGYSDYLLPIGPDLLLGIGKDATDDGRVQGVKVSLFDVADATAPKELATRVFGQAGSQAALDFSRHGVNLFEVGGITRVALPIRVHDTPTGDGEAWFGPTDQGLFRFDIDRGARSLTDRPTLTGRTFGSEIDATWRYPVANERAVQIDEAVYYLTAEGTLMGARW